MQDAPKTEKRKDSRGRVLRTGESQRPDGSYQFRWSEAGQRRTRYAPVAAPEPAGAHTAQLPQYHRPPAAG